MNKFDLQERLIDFSVDIIELINHIKTNFAGQHLSKQLLRSATSSALNYAEAM